MGKSDDRPEDLVELNSKYGFWLKPIAKLNISVQLPQLIQGKSISTSSIMDKINKRAKLQFKSLKVTKTTIDFLRLEGELESLKQLEIVEQRLNRVKIKLEGFDEQLKLKANKIKIGPFKHEWEQFFRDNPQMEETKPGYRPDTVLIQNLPLKYFGGDSLKTNWLIDVFSAYGDIRRFHVPLLDEIEREKINQKKNLESTGFKKFNFNSTKHSTFDCYLMYKDYVGFVQCMDGLRGMKLIKCEKDQDNKTQYIEHEIKVDFDKTKHLSDKAIRRRQIAKKYGIETLDDLNEYKKKAKERKLLYEQRTKQLKVYRKSTKNLLNFLARLVEIDEKKREEDELRQLNENLLKERLLEEERKLRNKLIERKRNQVMEQLKERERSFEQDDFNRINRRDNQYNRNDEYSRNNDYNRNGEYSKNNEYNRNGEYSRNDDYNRNNEYERNNEYNRNDDYNRNNEYERNNEYRRDHNQLNRFNEYNRDNQYNRHNNQNHNYNHNSNQHNFRNYNNQNYQINKSSQNYHQNSNFNKHHYQSRNQEPNNFNNNSYQNSNSYQQHHQQQNNQYHNNFKQRVNNFRPQQFSPYNQINNKHINRNMYQRSQNYDNERQNSRDRTNYNDRSDTNYNHNRKLDYAYKNNYKDDYQKDKNRNNYDYKHEDDYNRDKKPTLKSLICEG